MDPLSIVSSLVGVLNAAGKIQSILDRYKILPSEKIARLTASINTLKLSSEFLVRLLQDNPGVVPDAHATAEMLAGASSALERVERRLLETAENSFKRYQGNLESDIISIETFRGAVEITIQVIQLHVNMGTGQRDHIYHPIAYHHARTSVLSIETINSSQVSAILDPGVERLMFEGSEYMSAETGESNESPEPPKFAEWLKTLKPRHVRLLEKISFAETKNEELIIPEPQDLPQSNDSVEAESAVEVSSDGVTTTRIEQWLAYTDSINSESGGRDNRLNNGHVSSSHSAQDDTFMPRESPSRNEVSHGDERVDHEELTAEGQPRLLLRLLICDSDFKGTHLNTISFTRERFASYMEETQLPVDLVQFMFTGTPLLLRTSDDGSHRPSFVLRLPMAKSENWTMGMSFDVKTGITSAMIHGLQKDEYESFVAELRSIKSASVHPFHLAATLCDLLTEADSNGVKQLAAGLFKIENKTIWHGYWQPGKASELLEDRTPEHDFEYLTRSLNHIHSRLAFFEMRINANATLVSKIRSFLTNQDEEWVSIIPKDEYDKLVATLDQRLISLQAEHDALLAEVACNQKIANGQLQIVYNLIAQHDNKENLRMAELSTQIAAITKDDSFAMRTIAVMTIAFLPATAISSLFSMGMFNWQAEPSATVVSNRFWIYWVIAVPLTLIVFALWIAWIQHHRTSESHFISVSAKLPLSGSMKLINLVKELGSRIKNVRKRARDPEKDQQSDTIDDAGVGARGIELDHLRVRVNTFTQGPLR